MKRKILFTIIIVIAAALIALALTKPDRSAHYDAVRTLHCENNDLTELDVLNNTALIYLDCFNNKLTKLNFTKNTALVQLDFERNQDTSIDLSNNISLEELYCSDNKLTKLILSKNSALNMLYCYRNNISGQNMDDLIGSLPQNDTSTLFGFFVIDFSEGAEKEGNVITKSQVEAAKAIGWKPLQWDNTAYNWVDYPGSDD